MRAIVILCVVACAALMSATAFGQGYVPYTPGSTATVQPYCPQPAIGPQIQQPVPQEWTQHGYREQFTRTDTHDVRPLREWETHPQTYQQPVYQPQPAYQQPMYQPQPYYTAPQYQYCPPRQYCVPQYCVPQYQYCQPRPWWQL